MSLRQPILLPAPETIGDAELVARALTGDRWSKEVLYRRHEYIKKRPVRRTLKHQMLGQRCSDIPDETLVRTYGADQLVTVCGPAGSGFVGDPYYFHRGAHPSEGVRALLQIELGCRAYRTWYFDV